jgi:[ribosomal protein S5]-alanine N-acetyltransferase
MNTKYLKQNNRIGLRLLEEADITDRYLDWFKDERITAFLSAKNLSRQDVLDHLNAGRESGDFEMLAICILDSGLHVGNIKVGPINKVDRIADLPIVLGDRSFHGKDIASEAVDLGSQYALDNLDIRKVCGSVYSENKASLRCYEKGGWHIECILPNQFEVNGEIQDEVFIARYKD